MKTNCWERGPISDPRIFQKNDMYFLGGQIYVISGTSTSNSGGFCGFARQALEIPADSPREIEKYHLCKVKQQS